MITLEQQITKGHVTYIHSFSYNEVLRQLQINVFYDPDLHTVAKLVVTFKDIINFNLNEDEIEEDCIDQIIGIDEYPEGGIVKYVIHTDQREFIFSTDTAPVIVEL